LIKLLSNEKNIHNLIVTRGASGSILYNKAKKQFFYANGYANNITDKIGAGDAMLSLIAPCLKSKIDIDVSLLISSLAASQSIENFGNKFSIKKIDILKTLENILK
jgi:sugar/nucleoside kinase (ribokinase family)